MKIRKILAAVLCLLTLTSCTQYGFKGNPTAEICLRANDNLYIFGRITKEEELPEGLEFIGNIEDYGSWLPTENFVATCLDYGTALYMADGDAVYAYDDNKEAWWEYERCDTCLVIDGALYYDNGAGNHMRDELPENCKSAGRVEKSLNGCTPCANGEALGIAEGTEIYSSGSCVYLPTVDNRYKRLDKFLDIEE